MRYRVPKSLNMPLLFFGLPADDLAIVMVFVSMLIVVFKSAGFQQSILGIFIPILIGLSIAFLLKKIAEIRPVGYIRHIMHKYGMWNDKMRANHLIAPGKKLYSP
jgi:Co/Zn/Cd efflux system component